MTKTTRTRRTTRRKRKMMPRRPTPSPEGFNGFYTINIGLVALDKITE